MFFCMDSCSSEDLKIFGMMPVTEGTKGIVWISWMFHVCQLFVLLDFGIINCGTPRMPEGPGQQKAPSRSWHPNELFRQSALEAVRRNAGMSTGHAREDAVGLDPFARRDLGRDLGRHLELSLGSLSRNLGRRIGITGRFLSSLPPIFHASTLDLLGLVDDNYRQVTIEIVDPSSDELEGNDSPEPPASGPDEDRPFGTYSSDSDWSDSDSACDKIEKPSQDAKPKTRQNSRHAGLGLADLDHSASSTTRQRGSPTFRCAMPRELETLFEVDQSGSSDESDVDALSECAVFSTDSSDEWEADVRKSKRRVSFKFQSIYSGPPNSEEEDGIEILDVEVFDAISLNVDDTGHNVGTEGENLEESRAEVQSDAIEEIGIILEEEEEESPYCMVGEYQRSIEDNENGENEVDEDKEPIVDDDKVPGRVDRDEETGEEKDYELSHEESHEEEKANYSVDEYDQNSLSEGQVGPSMQGKESLEREIDYDFNDIDGEDETTIENNTDECDPDRIINDEEELSTEEIEDIDGDEDVFATVEELAIPDVDVVNE